MKIFFFSFWFSLLLVHTLVADNFLLDNTSIFKSNSQTRNHNTTDMLGNEKNIEEWQKKYPTINNLDFFHEVIYRSSLDEIDSLVQALKNGKNPFPDNEFAKFLLLNKDKDALNYLLFAKKCEPFAVQISFDRQTKEVNYKVNALAKEGENYLKNIQNNFFKQRYAFQLIRLAYYHDSAIKTIELFDEIAFNYEKNYIYYRALLHKAFSLKKHKEQNEAILLFAEVYTYSAELRNLVLFNIDFIYDDNENLNTYIISDEVWQKTLDKVNNLFIKNTLYKLYFYYKNDINPIYLQGLFSNKAELAETEMIFLRQLHIAEKRYFMPNLTQDIDLDSAKLTYGYDAPPPLPREKKTEAPKGFFTKLLESFFKWLKELFGSKRNQNLLENKQVTVDITNLSENKDLIALENMALKIAETKKDSTAILYMGIAYLQMMRAKYELAKSNLIKAKGVMLKDKEQMQQLLYIETLLEVLQTNNITPEIENIVVKNTQKLWKDSLENNQWQKTLLFSELGRKYLAQNDLAQASLSFAHANKKRTEKVLLDFYATNEDLDVYLDFIKGQSNTPIKKLFWYLLPKTEVEKNNFIKDLQATKLAREGKFTEALNKLKAISPNYWGINYKIQNKNVGDSTEKVFTIRINGVNVQLNNNENNYNAEEECTQIITSFGSSFTEQDTFQTFPNKMIFLAELVKLETLAQEKEGDESAKIYTKMANLIYHTPFWLYNNAIWRCQGMVNAMKDVSPLSYPFNVNKQVATQLHNRKKHLALVYCVPYLANIYYKMGFDIAKSQDIKATALLGQCFSWEKRLASHWEDGITNDYRPFKMFESEYANTPQAKELIKAQEKWRLYE